MRAWRQSPLLPAFPESTHSERGLCPNCCITCFHGYFSGGTTSLSSSLPLRFLLPLSSLPSLPTPSLSFLWPSLRFWGSSPCSQHHHHPSPHSLYLLLAQHQHALWLDGVIRCQVLAVAALGAILVGFPDPIPGGPGDTDVVPLAVIDYKGQLSHLGRRTTYRT